MSDYDYMYSVRRTIAEAQKALEIDAPQQAKFYLDMASEVVKLHTEPKYNEVLHGLFRFFEDGDQTFTRMLDMASSAQNEVMRLSNYILEHLDENESACVAYTSDTQEFFEFFNNLMWVLRPLAMEAERSHEDLVRKHEEMRRQREALEAKKKEENKANESVIEKQ